MKKKQRIKQLREKKNEAIVITDIVFGFFSLSRYGLCFWGEIGVGGGGGV